MAVSRKSPSPPPESRADAPCHVIFGNDSFLRSEALHRLTRADSDGGCTYDGDAADAAAVLDDLRTPGLFAARRLVVVRDADDFISDHRALLEKYLETPSEFGVLVLECRALASNTRIYKRVATLGGLIECKTPPPAALPAWASSRAERTHGRKLAAAAARTLIDLVGDTELGRLDAELSKLSAYVGARTEITEDDVEALVGDQRSRKVFGIIDAIARQAPREALELWDGIIRNDRDAPFKAVGGLAWALRRLVDAKRFVGRGGTLAEAVSSMRLFMKPDDLARQLNRFSLRQWEELQLKLLRLDSAAKSGGLDTPLAVERYIVAAAGSRSG